MKKKIIYTILGLVVVAAGVLAMRVFGASQGQVSLETAPVVRGDINELITATGTLEAVETVEVGTQVSGVIEKIFVDYNSVVKKGQLLAQLDETSLRATLDQSKATVDQAEANLKYQSATYERYKALKDKKLIAESDFDLVEYNYNNAVASLASARSAYNKNKINLDYARIYSPIDGIILDRAVDEGQTVAASFSTPTLFTIANDLTRMQVEASVDEADIGRVSLGQRVDFTVDAYPGVVFEGSVIQIRLEPVESSNVITYTVVIDAPNPDKKLMPGMTASVEFFVTELKDIVLMPAKALNFKLDEQLALEYAENHPEIEVDLKPQPKNDDLKLVWVKSDTELKMHQVKLGETNETFYEVLSGLSEHDEVVVSMKSLSVSEAKSAAKSPFMPTRPGQNRK
ncbi:efflux RND transporter periplasmic adaptor subunit [Mangrovibacterium sp.]|uniref:efflux RND transporter periplasmic adaptor subunit n=1 Tax=Mangrovibacterium sp. TaxID=1961364 RepID=UPI003564C59C